MILLSLYAFAGKQNKAEKIISDYFTWIDAGNLKDVGSILTEDFKAWVPFSTAALDKTGFVEICEAFKTSFPDMNHEIFFSFTDINMVAVRGLFKGINTGVLLGDPSTKNTINIHFNSLFVLDENGKINSLNIQYDNESFDSQVRSGFHHMNKTEEDDQKRFLVGMDASEINQFINYFNEHFTIASPFFTDLSTLSDFQNFLIAQKTAFPDLKNEVVEIIREGKQVTTRGIFKGTNTGPFMGNQPSGNKVELPFLIQDELDSKGKIRTRYLQFDVNSFKSQLCAGFQTNESIEGIFKIMQINSLVNKMNFFINLLQE